MTAAYLIADLAGIETAHKDIDKSIEYCTDRLNQQANFEISGVYSVRGSPSSLSALVGS